MTVLMNMREDKTEGEMTAMIEMIVITETGTGTKKTTPEGEHPGICEAVFF